MYGRSHVIISLSDSEEEESDETSTCTSEVSDVTNNNTAAVNALGKYAKSPDNGQRTKKKRRRRKKRKLKSSNINTTRTRKEFTGSQEAIAKASASKVTDAANVPLASKETNLQKPIDPKSHNPATIVKRIHSAPAVISKRMVRKEYAPTKPLNSDCAESKPGSTSQSQTTITHLTEKDKSRPTSDYAMNTNVFHGTSAHMERQKSVLNSLKNTIQRSLPPVLHTQTLSFNNKTKPTPHSAVLQHSPEGMLNNTNVSKVFLRYAQPTSGTLLTQKSTRRGNNNTRATLITNYNVASLDSSQFRAGLSARNDLFSTSQGCITDGSTDTEKSECRPKSILRKDKGDIENSGINHRKSVRFNSNDQISYM